MSMFTVTRREVADKWAPYLDSASGVPGLHSLALSLCARAAFVVGVAQCVATLVSCYTLEVELVAEAKEMWESACKRTSTPFSHRLVDCEAIYSRAYDGQRMSWVVSRFLPAIRASVGDVVYGALASPVSAVGTCALLYTAALAAVWLFEALRAPARGLRDGLWWMGRRCSAYFGSLVVLYRAPRFGQPSGDAPAIHDILERGWSSVATEQHVFAKQHRKKCL